MGIRRETRAGLWLAGAGLLLLPGMTAQVAQTKLDLNTATFAQLRALPGMGDEYARRVIAGRPYRAKNQLATRGVLPQQEYERIEERVVAHQAKEPSGQVGQASVSR